MLLADPHQLSLLKERNPRLAESINNAEEFTKVCILQFFFNLYALNYNYLIKESRNSWELFFGRVITFKRKSAFFLENTNIFDYQTNN